MEGSLFLMQAISRASSALRPQRGFCRAELARLGVPHCLDQRTLRPATAMV